MRNLLKILIAGLVITCAGFALSGPAQAVLWASKSNPLYGVENGAKFAKTYGNFVNEGGVYATSRSYQYDMQPGGNYVRVETDFYFYETGSACASPCWLLDASLQTDQTRVDEWVFDYRRRGLHGGASAARGGMDICEIQSWSPDPCSTHAWASFNY